MNIILHIDDIEQNYAVAVGDCLISFGYIDHQFSFSTLEGCAFDEIYLTGKACNDNTLINTILLPTLVSKSGTLYLDGKKYNTRRALRNIRTRVIE
jgi:hypothetical protein